MHKMGMRMGEWENDMGMGMSQTWEKNGRISRSSPVQSSAKDWKYQHLNNIDLIQTYTMQSLCVFASVLQFSLMTSKNTVIPVTVGLLLLSFSKIQYRTDAGKRDTCS